MYLYMILSLVSLMSAELIILNLIEDDYEHSSYIHMSPFYANIILMWTIIFNNKKWSQLLKHTYIGVLTWIIM